MTGNGSGKRRGAQRREDLLADRATTGLSEAELDELASLSDREGGQGYELAAAAVHLALLSEEQAPSDLLRKRLENDARAFFAGRQSVVGLGGGSSAGSVRARRWRGYATVAMAVCAAAVVLLIWFVRDSGPASTMADIMQEREMLLSQQGDVFVWPWQAGPDATAQGASGDVVWSDGAQQGFMRIRGLAANDPDEFQYQLWIFDAGRDERYPVDGGVFDISADAAEIVIPIAAKLRVGDPALFAVTVERPGGVVVSSRERIALLAEQI